MKRLDVALAVLIIYYLEVISAQGGKDLKKSDSSEWFGMTIAEVNEQCKRNTNYTLDYNTCREYKMYLLKYLEPVENPDTKLSDHIFFAIYNPKMIEKLKDLLLLIQNCLDDEVRLDPESLYEVLAGIIQLHTRRVARSEPFTEKEMKKCEKRSGVQMRTCTQTFNNIFDKHINDREQTIFDLLTGNFVGRSSCKDALPLEKCAMKALKTCNPKIKQKIRIMLSPPEDIICNDFLRETDLSSIDDISNEKVESGSFMRLLHM